MFLYVEISRSFGRFEGRDLDAIGNAKALNKWQCLLKGNAMKKQFCLIVLMSVCITKLTVAQVTFHKNYGTNYWDYATKIIQKNNGEY